MSSSFMYHVFGLQNYEYVHQKFGEGRAISRVRPRCDGCIARSAIRSGLSGEGCACRR